MICSRISGFYKKSVDERLEELARASPGEACQTA